MSLKNPGLAGGISPSIIYLVLFIQQNLVCFQTTCINRNRITEKLPQSYGIVFIMGHSRSHTWYILFYFWSCNCMAFPNSPAGKMREIQRELSLMN